MELVVALVHPDHRLMFELLAATGLRRSELLALEGRHLPLDGARAARQGAPARAPAARQGLVIGPLKSRHARRDLPIPLDLADRLAALRTRGQTRSGVRESQTGTPLDPRQPARPGAVDRRARRPASSGPASTPSATPVASRLFAEGRNVVQVQRWLGHHSPSFTLDTYVHLLDDDLGEPLAPASANGLRTEATPTDLTPDLAEALDALA